MESIFKEYLRSQGLPINTIILIAIGVLILILLVVFSLGGFRGLGTAKPDTLAAAVSQCQSYCSALNGMPNTADVMASDFCKAHYYVNGTVYSCLGLVHTCVFNLANGSTYCLSGYGNSPSCQTPSPASACSTLG